MSDPIPVPEECDFLLAWRATVGTDPGNAEVNRRQALAIFSATEDAQLVARGRGDISIFDDTVRAYRAAGLFL
jgi:hypothetical protein